MEPLSNILLAITPYALAGLMVVGFFAMLRRSSRRRQATGQGNVGRQYGNQITIVKRDAYEPEVIRTQSVVHRVLTDDSGQGMNERETVIIDIRSPAHEQFAFVEDPVDTTPVFTESSVPVMDAVDVGLSQSPAHWTRRPVATASDLAFTPDVHPLVELPRHPVVQEFRVRLGLDRRGGSLYLPAGHALVARDTGGGKTNITVNIVTHYIKWGWRVWYGNPKFVPVDDDGLDLTPFVERCERTATRLGGDMGKSILNMLEEAMISLLDRVDESQISRKPIGTPLVIVVEELKALLTLWKKLEFDAKNAEKKPRDPRFKYARGYDDAVKRGIQAMEIILALGRQLKTFLVVTAQDSQVQNIGLNAGSQKNFQWVIAHPDLDQQSLINSFGMGREEELAEVAALIANGHDWYCMYKQDNVKRITTFNSERVTNDWLMSMLQEVPIVKAFTPGEEDNSSPVKESIIPERQGRFKVIGQASVVPPPVEPDLGVTGAEQLEQQRTADPPPPAQAAPEAPGIVQPGSLPANVEDIIKVALAVGKLLERGVDPGKISQRAIAQVIQGRDDVTGRHVTDVREGLERVKPLLTLVRDPRQPGEDTKIAL